MAWSKIGAMTAHSACPRAYEILIFGNIQRIEVIGKILSAEPRLTWFTEYGLEKNGVRFPTRDVTEEAYLNPKGKKFLRSLTTVTYIETASSL
jgi:hypothetical protein